MADSKTLTSLDPFILNEVYPEPAALFAFENKSVEEIYLGADIVLDTNVLLILLNTGSRGIAEVEKIYTKLIAENRLFVPAQVAREFTKNKPEKIKNLYHQLQQRKQNNIKISYCPLFEGLGEYSQIEEQEKKLLGEMEEYSKRISKMLEVIKQWGSNDPVSAMYRKVGLDKRVINFPLDSKKFLELKDKRYLHKLPPGYKDSRKDDEGIGDFLIWSEILELGKSNKKNLIFVTGEEKSDWWTKSSNNELHVRYELVDEYRRSSGGCSVQLVNFSRFLELFEAPLEAIDQAKAAQIEELDEADQESLLNAGVLKTHIDFPSFIRASEAAVKHWIKNRLGSSMQALHSNYQNVDFVAVGDSDQKIAFEVKAIRHVEHIGRRIRELLDVSKQFTEGKPKNDTAFRGIFVAESLEKAIEASEIVKSISTPNKQFGFVIGYLNEDLSFSEVFSSYDDFVDDVTLM